MFCLVSLVCYIDFGLDLGLRNAIWFQCFHFFHTYLHFNISIIYLGPMPKCHYLMPFYAMICKIECNQFMVDIVWKYLYKIFSKFVICMFCIGEGSFLFIRFGYVMCMCCMYNVLIVCVLTIQRKAFMQDRCDVCVLYCMSCDVKTSLKFLLPYFKRFIVKM